MEFRVIWEVLVHAESPRHAAALARTLQLDPSMPATAFSVWDPRKAKMHRVDVAEPSGQLDPRALRALRSRLRRLQCGDDLAPGYKDVAAVMLLFLDDEEGKMRRHGP
jgi:hypothetical protein